MTAPTLNKIRHVNVRLDKLKHLPPGKGQREYREGHAKKIAQRLDLDLIGTITVCEKADGYYIIDGRHRVEALIMEGFGDSLYACQLVQAPTEREQAAHFLGLNDTKPIPVFQKFLNAITAEDAEACDIQRIVRANRLVISQHDVAGAISCVAALTSIYRSAGGVVLGRALRIVRDAFGDAGLEKRTIEGIALMVQRYSDCLDDAHAVDRLRTMNGGVGGLLGKAEMLTKQTGQKKPVCVAASAVEHINKGAKAKDRLTDWWKA